MQDIQPATKLIVMFLFCLPINWHTGQNLSRLVGAWVFVKCRYEQISSNHVQDMKMWRQNRALPLMLTCCIDHQLQWSALTKQAISNQIRKKAQKLSKFDDHISFPMTSSTKKEHPIVHTRWCDIHCQMDVASSTQTSIWDRCTCMSMVTWTCQCRTSNQLQSSLSCFCSVCQLIDTRAKIYPD